MSHNQTPAAAADITYTPLNISPSIRCHASSLIASTRADSESLINSEGTWRRKRSSIEIRASPGPRRWRRVLLLSRASLQPGFKKKKRASETAHRSPINTLIEPINQSFGRDRGASPTAWPPEWRVSPMRGRREERRRRCAYLQVSSAVVKQVSGASELKLKRCQE